MWAIYPTCLSSFLLWFHPAEQNGMLLGLCALLALFRLPGCLSFHPWTCPFSSRSAVPSPQTCQGPLGKAGDASLWVQYTFWRPYGEAGLAELLSGWHRLLGRCASCVYPSAGPTFRLDSQLSALSTCLALRKGLLSGWGFHLRQAMRGSTMTSL